MNDEEEIGVCFINYMGGGSDSLWCSRANPHAQNTAFVDSDRYCL
jgi:hypothetical protein